MLRFCAWCEREMIGRLAVGEKLPPEVREVSTSGICRECYEREFAADMAKRMKARDEAQAALLA